MQHAAFTFRGLSALLLVHLLNTWPSATAAVASASAGAQLPLRTFSMPEETPAGTPLANVAKDFVVLLSTNLSASASAGGSGSGGQSEEPLRFALLPGSGAQEFVAVNASTGALVVARPFDREAACAALRICCPASVSNALNGNGNGNGHGSSYGASGIVGRSQSQSQAQMLVGAASASAADASRASNCALELTVRASRDSRYLLLDYRINGVPYLSHMNSHLSRQFIPFV